MSKLQSHLLPRVHHRLLEEERMLQDKDEERIQLLESLLKESSSSEDEVKPPSQSHPPPNSSDVERVYIHADRIYGHNILHINYTSYDVRQETDIVNPNTSRKDVMCLRSISKKEKKSVPPSKLHRFMYARVLGVYHVNVIYCGRGAVDLRKCRFDVLWVR
jgi:hypothetical protein